MGEGVTLASILSDIGSIITSAFGWVGTAVTTITSNPIILLSAIIGFVGLGIGLLKRLMSVKA